MSDIRFNRWLHQSGTGGVSQDSSGNIGIGTTVPTKALDVVGDVKIGDTISIENTSGIITATTFSGVSADFSGNVSIAGTLTYEDVTNIDSVGVVTARSDVHIGAGLSVVGVSTLGNTIVGGATTELIVGGDARITGILTIGTSSLTLDGTNNLITVGSGVTINGNTGIISATGGLNAKLLGTPELAAIDSSITDTAVDVFVYDTRKDSDGGAWRKRTQHTSWYNETLNTATRGSRREFPAVAVIVAESNQVTIYDGDDPDLPMWMVFNANTSVWNTNSTWLSIAISGATPMTAVSALNANLAVSGTYGIVIINFIDESHIQRGRPTINATYAIRHKTSGSIASRNDSSGQYITNITGVIVNTNCNDVAITVLPNAPIDSATGLPIPTIAVATNGGVSVIRDDGTVVDIIDSNSGYRKNLQVKFTTDNKVVYTESSAASEYGWMYIHEIPSSDETITINTKDTALGWYDTRTQSYMQNILGVTIDASINVDRNIGLNVGIGTIIPNIVTGNNHIFVAPSENSGITLIEENRSTTNSGLVAYATTSYNTGWQHGAIKGAFLSDTDATNVTGTELVTNGGFDSDSDWSKGTNWTIGSGVASHTGSQGYLTQEVFTVGNYYALTFTVTGTTILAGGSGITPSNVTYTNGTYTHYGYAISTTLNFYSNTTTTLDNVSVRLAEEDRSVNNKGLAVYGTITKSAVATGAELVAYSGFSASNHLAQPYNSDLNPGSGSYSVVAWFKTESNNSGSGVITGLGNGDLDEVMLVYVSSTYGIYFDYGNGSEYVYLSSSDDRSMVRDGNWHQVVCQVTAGQIGEIYIDGIKKSTTQNVAAPSTWSQWDTNYQLYIGCGRGLGTLPFSGSISLVRYSLSKMSTEQIKKIYEDEKVLFQENAACTLHGSSDAVTALAYDDSTNLLYAGTSSGRSDFQGLRRINNTTTAVTTAISASNGLVAEQ